MKDFIDEKLEALTKLGHEIDCYSYRKNNLPAGKATEDCDVAIDIISNKLEIEDIGQFETIKDPYSKNQHNLHRLKFNYGNK
jgi:hypothetical protein